MAVWHCREKEIEYGSKVLLMGIVNVTPDSFSDGGDWLDPATALTHARALEAQGADILDIGGQSTRPGHTPVTDKEEWARLEPVLSVLCKETALPVSEATVRGWLARSGIKTVGEKIGAVRLDALERLIARNGFVADARVTVSYSGVLHVAVWQRTPLMRLLIDGYNSYVTEEGYLFAVPRASSVYVPVITGTYRPPFPASYVGYAADYRREQMQQIDDKIAELEREKYPLYRRELKNDENIRSLRRMLIKKRWFESSESFGERVRELRKRKEQLRRKYRYEAQVIQSAIDKISEKQEAERRRQKILEKRYEDFSKLTTFVKWMENDDFWRSEIVQITARTTESGAIDLELTPRSGNYTILFGRLDDAEQKLDKLLRFYREGLGKAGWDRYRTINVKYAGQVVCTEW